MAALLTRETVAAYAAQRLAAGKARLPEGDLEAQEISGGNLNYAFRVAGKEGDAAARSVFVKQAPGFIKVFGPEAKLDEKRMRLEVSAYREMATALGKEAAERVLPEIFSFDEERMAVVMEFLEGYAVLQPLLYAGEARERAAEGVGRFMGALHARTHAALVPGETAERLAKEYENGELRAVQLEHVFTKPFRGEADAAKLAELEELRAKYRGEDLQSCALLHGDLHPGSAMVSGEERVRVIDPEFAVYGPPGLDVGSFLSGYALATVHDAARKGGQARAKLLSAMEACWRAYLEAAAPLGAERLKCVEEDAVAFAACEVARTALGCAGERGLPAGEGKEVAEERALELAWRLILERRSGDGGAMALLLRELAAF